MRKPKKGAQKARPSAQQRKGKIGYFIFVSGDDPTSPDDINVEVLGTLKAAIEEARMELDNDGDVYNGLRAGAACSGRAARTARASGDQAVRSLPNPNCEACKRGDCFMNVAPLYPGYKPGDPSPPELCAAHNAEGNHHIVWNGSENEILECGSERCNELTKRELENEKPRKHVVTLALDAKLGRLVLLLILRRKNEAEGDVVSVLDICENIDDLEQELQNIPGEVERWGATINLLHAAVGCSDDCTHLNRGS